MKTILSRQLRLGVGGFTCSHEHWCFSPHIRPHTPHPDPCRITGAGGNNPKETIGRFRYRDTRGKTCHLKSPTWPSEKLVETLGTSVTLLETIMAVVAHLNSVDITAAIKNRNYFEWIRSKNCSHRHQEIVDAVVRGIILW
jgi:hypothetical protein